LSGKQVLTFRKNLLLHSSGERKNVSAASSNTLVSMYQTVRRHVLEVWSIRLIVIHINCSACVGNLLEEIDFCIYIEQVLQTRITELIYFLISFIFINLLWLCLQRYIHWATQIFRSLLT
jgi:hypothetical protein